MKLQQCMGGGALPNGCTVRDKCAHYWAPKQKNVPPSERLCIPHEDGEAMTLRPIELQPSVQEQPA